MTTAVLKKPKTEYGHHWEDSFILEEVKITKVLWDNEKKSIINENTHCENFHLYIWVYMIDPTNEFFHLQNLFQKQISNV